MRYRKLLGRYTKSLYFAGMLALGACSGGQQQEDPSKLEEQSSEEASSPEGDQASDSQTQAIEQPTEAMPPTPEANASSMAQQVETPAPQAAPVAEPDPLALLNSGLVADNELSQTGGLEMGAQGTEAAPGLPEMGAKLSYIVKKGDTLAAISKRIFGNRKLWRDLAKLSGIRNANKIFPGDVVYYQLNEKSLAFAKTYENLHREETVVAKGETLAKIATRVYGTSVDWRHIWRQNDQINAPDHLPEGMKVFYVSAKDLGVKAKIAGKVHAKTVAKNVSSKVGARLIAAQDLRALNGYRAL